jgi:hypothetical protein
VFENLHTINDTPHCADRDWGVPCRTGKMLGSVWKLDQLAVGLYPIAAASISAENPANEK